MKWLTNTLQKCRKVIGLAASKSLGAAKGLWASAQPKINAGWQGSLNWCRATAWPWINTKWQQLNNWRRNTATPWVKAQWQRFNNWRRATAVPWIKAQWRRLFGKKPSRKKRKTPKTSDGNEKMKPEKFDSLVVGLIMAASLAYVYTDALRTGSWILAATLSVVMFTLYVFKNRLKIALCRKRISGCIPNAEHLMPVFKSGHLLEWAVPRGLRIKQSKVRLLVKAKKVKGKLVPDPEGTFNMPDPSGAKITVDEIVDTSDEPDHSGAEIGIWWKGWFAWLRGIVFPMLFIELVHKRPGALPNESLSQQYERLPNQPIMELRHYINRYMLAFQVKLNDGSIVNISLFAIGGKVRYPGLFWIKQPSPFTVWESAAKSSVSSCCRGYSFEELFREDKNDTNNKSKKKKEVRAFKIIQQYMHKDEDLALATELIGMSNVIWQMEDWEDASDKSVIETRTNMAKELATQETRQRTARAAVHTAQDVTEQRIAEQKQAEEQYKLFLKQCGVDDITTLPEEEQARIRMLAVTQFGDEKLRTIILQMLKVDERKATKDLTTLVESGSNTSAEVLISTSSKGGKS